MEITLSISKEDVMQEVGITTAYTGGKMIDSDENAPHRISTVDEDENHLERFWEESRADLCQELIGLVTFEGMVKGNVIIGPADPLYPVDQQDPNVAASAASPAPVLPALANPYHYELRLDVSKSFDEALLPSMKLSLRSFFVHNIVAKWYIYTNKGEAGDYADKADTLLDDIHRKAVYKKKPTRPTYDD